MAVRDFQGKGSLTSRAAAAEILLPPGAAVPLSGYSKSKGQEVFAELAVTAHRRRTQSHFQSGQSSCGKGIFTLEELDAAMSSVSDKASEIRGAMKLRKARIKQLQKLIEQAQNFKKTKPVHDECKQIHWKGKQEKFAEAHQSDLTIWEAANRYLRANLPDMKLTPKAWQTELTKLTDENEAEYAKMKVQREAVSDLQKICRYVDIVLKENAPQQSKTRNHNIYR